MKRIIFFTSSHKIGLTGQLTEQALCFIKMGQGEFLFISGENEQFPGLFKKLEQHMVPHATITGIDEHAEFSRLVREFRNVAVQFRPDFVTVHTNWQLAIAVLARLLFSLDYSLVYVIHGYRHNYRFRSVIARFLIGTALYVFSDHVIVPSGFLRKQFGFLKEKNKLIFIGEGEIFFEDHPLPSFSRTLRFIFGGIFRAGKNQALLIHVLKQYIDKSGNQDVELYLPGNGPLLENCRVLARELGLEDKVFFPGFVNRDEMLPLYLRCQFAVAPTNVETFGHCIVEPFVLGRVVITRHIGAADDIIRHGETGFFFDTERDLLDLLLAVLPDQALCARVAANAKQAREPFRWELVCQKHFELIYDAPVSKRRSSVVSIIKSIYCSFIRIFVIGYIHLYVVMIRLLGLRMRGLGFALRILRQEYVFHVYGQKFWFNPRCAGAYCIMPAGYWNEPETHVFLETVLERVSGDIAFIDVGASVGEMVIPMAIHKKVRHVTAFEPQAQCALAIEKSAQLNGLSNISVVPCAASEKSGVIGFASSLSSPTAAAVSSLSHESIESLEVPCVTVDETIAPVDDLHTIMMIDVEGHEPSVMRGAVKLVKTALPLIIFEYNSISKQHFTLDDIRDILPDSYRYYRLRGDGRLDQDFSNSWNCVAVPDGTDFAKICADSIVC